jgi:Hemerythrin HHE cation binding domain
MAKLDFYGNYHKALRRALFELSARAGLTDYARAESVAQLRGEFARVARALREHGAHEDTYMHPLLAKYAPEVLEKMDRQHADLDPALDALEQMVHGAAFYAGLNRYIGAYLEHLADEEEVANPVLWQRCPHEELADAVRRFRASFALDQVAANFEFMLPALNAVERADLYAIVRDNAPRPAFEALLGVAEKTLAKPDYDELRKRLSM